MFHLQLYYSLRHLPFMIFSKANELNPLGRWTMRRPDVINTYLASLDHEDGTLNGVQYCRKTTKKLLSESKKNSNNVDSFSEFILTQERL